VLTICGNETRRRLAGGREGLPLESVQELAAADDPLDATTARVDVRRALERLSAADRRLLWLRYGLDLTQPEIAEALNIAEGTAKVRLHRLRSALRSALE
jgi:RNA polymerase sigma-70 factor (ECF subfamily)